MQDIVPPPGRVSDLHEAQKTTWESGQCFRDLLDMLPAGVYITDRAGQVTFYNRAAADPWGCEPVLLFQAA